MLAYNGPMEPRAEVLAAHKHSIRHRAEIEASDKCGCFCCSRIFNLADHPHAEWADDNSTLLCPFCGIDSVIGSASGYPISVEFLDEMGRHWFNR
jgi:hypothetical protein